MRSELNSSPQVLRPICSPLSCTVPSSQTPSFLSAQTIHPHRSKLCFPRHICLTPVQTEPSTPYSIHLLFPLDPMVPIACLPSSYMRPAWRNSSEVDRMRVLGLGPAVAGRAIQIHPQPHRSHLRLAGESYPIWARTREVPVTLSIRTATVHHRHTVALTAHASLQ